ncbi:gamma-glutamyl phosphate reductase [Sporosarcina globispora]|uniref:Gamma-glutamyl phosphate reductase n=1 Tax=Sporosarcina globispora TaxID=1459 RepID=A0A0M0GFL1_SPOGL|nr:glutamate-5-semialdehyde dehydrogenase [Sporosarcina globispora]KON88226.1 gamma-glutamyl phosphate reductase [Sporosarcina globispora]
MELTLKGEKAKKAAAALAKMTTDQKNHALELISGQLMQEKNFILAENEKDLDAGRENGMSEALLDRLRLNGARLQDMAEALIQLTQLNDPVGEIISAWVRPNGLTITQVRVPLGVIGMIYEARPNVTVDASSLCLKTGNAVMLRGSSTAIHSNKAIVKVIHHALEKSDLPADAVQLIEDTSRETASRMFKLNDYLDVLIPRGGAKLIKTVVENSTVPVLETGAGNCHVFIDESADKEMAISIAINAKTQRPSVCNACETIIVHREWDGLKDLVLALQEKEVEIHGDEGVCGEKIIPAAEEDWVTEYLGLEVALKVVESADEAIVHINRYGTKHSESIVSSNPDNVEKFLNEVDAAAVYHNASTRFTDGFEFGFGAEIGISTQKLHARGPMGLPVLTSTKYIVKGNGQIKK